MFDQLRLEDGGTVRLRLKGRRGGYWVRLSAMDMARLIDDYERTVGAAAEAERQARVYDAYVEVKARLRRGPGGASGG